MRTKVLNDPEIEQNYQGTITLMDLQGTPTDYLVKLLINLYEECNLLQEIPQLIPKTIMVVLSAKIASGEIELN